MWSTVRMSMTEAGNLILPALPVRGVRIVQDWPDRMKLVRNRTIPITLHCGKNILDNMVFKISIGYTNLDTRQIQSRLGSRSKLYITHMPKLKEVMAAPLTFLSGFCMAIPRAMEEA